VDGAGGSLVSRGCIHLISDYFSLHNFMPLYDYSPCRTFLK